MGGDIEKNIKEMEEAEKVDNEMGMGDGRG